MGEYHFHESTCPTTCSIASTSSPSSPHTPCSRSSSTPSSSGSHPSPRTWHVYGKPWFRCEWEPNAPAATTNAASFSPPTYNARCQDVPHAPGLGLRPRLHGCRRQLHLRAGGQRGQRGRPARPPRALRPAVAARPEPADRRPPGAARHLRRGRVPVAATPTSTAAPRCTATSAWRGCGSGWRTTRASSARVRTSSSTTPAG
jgi:hypothetical protein